MSLGSSALLLNGRYKLIGSEISKPGDGELWGALDQEEVSKPLLLKAWPFIDERPDDVQRALWDAELRTLYRVRSTPGSEESLLQLCDVGIDHDARCFIMVFKTEGLQNLASLLGPQRGDHAWLSGRPEDRVALWQMLERFTDGLGLLHDQQVVHRNVVPESVFLESGEGPESARLGGFEWSIRLGRPAARAARIGWETVPEAFAGRAPFGPDADWFAFGMLAARCMLNIEHFDAPAVAPWDRYRGVLKLLAKPKGRLTALEVDFIGRLIAEDPATRLRHQSDISATIREIVGVLQDPGQNDDTSRRHLVIIDPANRRLVTDCFDRGFGELLRLEPGDTFDPKRAEHRSALHTFLYKDFADGATLTPVPNREKYVLSGRRMHLIIGPSVNEVDGKPTWQNAFCTGTSDYLSGAAANQVSIPPGQLEFFSTRERRVLGSRLAASARWEALLPRVDKARERREEQERFSDFLRITNQVDILVRDAELFRCEVVEVEEEGGSCTQVEVREVLRDHPPSGMFAIDGGMAEFLFREKHSGKPGNNLIQLCSPSSESIEDRPADPEWVVHSVDIPGRTAKLTPNQDLPKMPQVGDVHVLRTKGLGGQVLQIKRRKQAIAKLAKHTYLLESLTTPGQVLMDSGPVRLPVPLGSKTVDSSKLTQIQTILGVRPIYTVQGPPGTGKTHMVAWLLREILEEDPVAQVLITAQAHHAVDVLRAKVEQDAFADVSEERRPLTIRLRRAKPDQPGGFSAEEQGSEQQVTRELLEQTISRIEAVQPVGAASPVQAEWLAICKRMVAELNTRDASTPKEFRELVKRSASITYSTTGDGDLAALAGEVSYDWAIVEEAGKVHGFELALPLFLGHRWLLIGDPKQLSPYRIEDYEKAVAELSSTVAALEALPAPNKNVDREVLLSWRDRTPEQRGEFQQYCKRWLRLFAQLHKLCAHHEPQEGLLTGQHRMHPDIGELVSEVYYKGRLSHYTRDPDSGRPKPGILHNLHAPAEVDGRAIVWLDLPMASADETRAMEHGTPKYRNPAEAFALDRFLRTLRVDNKPPLDLAILSPYAQQVGYLRQQLDGPEFREMLAEAGLRLAPDPQRSQYDTGAQARDGFFTVDSFQGNQAEVIAISLVRNSTAASEAGLGFLVEPQRMNVLISRAERLLVLVGSWEFFRSQVHYVSRDPQQWAPLQHLALMVDRLEAWFKEGRAVLIPADLAGYEPPAALVHHEPPVRK
ncbi:AAA domain-containing protein [Micromonospora sp. NPDC049175]|uniref:AAA domain-containing protein n=1 Tax=Micromonospora sp. NPDC049175 TaxID=3364266 RepID=UPI00371000A2